MNVSEFARLLAYISLAYPEAKVSELGFLLVDVHVGAPTSSELRSIASEARDEFSELCEKYAKELAE